MSFQHNLKSITPILMSVIISQTLMGCSGQSTQKEQVKDKKPPVAEQTSTLVPAEKIRLDLKIAEDLKETNEFEKYKAETKDLTPIFETLDMSKSVAVEIVEGHNANVQKLFASLPTEIQSLKKLADTGPGVTTPEISLPESHYKLEF